MLRFERVLPLLSDVNVVVPALPGFPFAAPLTETGMTTAAMADAVTETMDELGYARYVVSGGDIGGDVAEHLATRHTDQVPAMHLTNVLTQQHKLVGGLTPVENVAVRVLGRGGWPTPRRSESLAEPIEDLLG